MLFGYHNLNCCVCIPQATNNAKHLKCNDSATVLHLKNHEI